MSLEPIEQGLRRLLSVEEADGDGCRARELYRYAAGEATAEESAAFERHLAGCEECRRDLEAFRGLPAEDAPVAPASNVLPLRRRIPAWAAAPLAAAAALLVGLALWRAQPPAPGRGDDPFRIKSGYQLHVAVQRGERRFKGVSGSAFEVGDALGFFYTAPADAYLSVFVADEAGSIVQAYPVGPPAKLPKGVEQRLELGAVVEKGTACEWVVALFSAQPLPAEAAKAALERAVARRGPECALPSLSVDAAADVFVLRRPAP